METIIYTGAQTAPDLTPCIHDYTITSTATQFFADHKLMSVPIRGRINDCVLVPLQRQVDVIRWWALGPNS